MNFGTGISSASAEHVKKSALWIMRAQHYISRTQDPRNYFLRHGMPLNTIPHLLSKYGLNYRQVTLDTTSDALKQTIGELTHLHVGTCIIYVANDHSSMGIIKHNGQAYLDPSPSPHTHSAYTWLDASNSANWYYIDHVRGNRDLNGLFISREEEDTFAHNVTTMFIIYYENRMTVISRSALNSISNLNQYFDYYF